MERKINLLVEGWLYYAHSFAMVTGQHLLDMAKRDDIELAFRHLPAPPNQILRKKQGWELSRLIWKGNDADLFKDLEESSEGFNPEARLRFSFPYDFFRHNTVPLTLFTVTENGPLRPFLRNGKTIYPDLLTKNKIQVITPSRWSANGLVKSGIHPDKIAIVPHGVDPVIFSPPQSVKERESIRKKLGWNDKYVFLNVSTFSPIKGIPGLIAAFSQLVDKHKDLVLALKGNDSIYHSSQLLRGMMRKVPRGEADKLARHIWFSPENLSRHQLVKLYQAADVLVAPYLAEGFNLPVLEAMACGLPVICTAGGPTDEFARGKGVWKIPSKIVPGNRKDSMQLKPSISALVELMENAILTPGFQDLAKLESTDHVIQNYTWKKSNDKLLQIIKKHCSQN